MLSALALSDGRRIRSKVSINEVKFRELSAPAIRRYVASREPMDKAGAYGIPGKAAIFIEDIRGSYSAIMGLPLFETAQLLDTFGYPL